MSKWPWEQDQDVTVMMEGKPGYPGKIEKIEYGYVYVTIPTGTQRKFYCVSGRPVPEGKHSVDTRRSEEILDIHIRVMTEEDRAYFEKKELIAWFSMHYWDRYSKEQLEAAKEVLEAPEDMAKEVHRVIGDMVDQKIDDMFDGLRE